MKVAPPAPTGIELTDDPAFRPRVRRLAAVSSVALGLIWYFAVRSTEAHGVLIYASLFAGWILMPTILWTSLRRPGVRRWVFLPSALVTMGLVALCATALPDAPLIRPGWLLATVGILFGGLLGGWFWFRWLPVPSSLDCPFSTGRWALIGAHVLMIVAGLGLVAISLYA